MKQLILIFSIALLCNTFGIAAKGITNDSESTIKKKKKRHKHLKHKRHRLHKKGYRHTALFSTDKIQPAA